LATSVVWREQAVTIPIEGEGLALEGAWQAGEASGGGVVAPPHPLYGGSLDHPVVTELAYALYCEGLPSLRFNWRGVGASQGEPDGDPALALRDYAAAVDHLACTVRGPLVAAGYSFGAVAALRAALADTRLRALVLVAPPVRMLQGLALPELGRPLLVIAGSEDGFAPADQLRALLDGVAGAHLELIEGVDHFFVSGLSALVAATRAAVARVT
jgi:alpha/beta superfamily hydrolase